MKQKDTHASQTKNLAKYQGGSAYGQAGFTLIELLLAIVLLAIISFSSASFYGRFITQNAAAETQDQLISSLRKAQLYSMMGKQNGTWGVHVDSSIIRFFQGTTYATRNTAFDESFSLNGPLTISGMTDIIFTKTTGLPNNTPSVTITANSTTKQFTINSQGIISRN